MASSVFFTGCLRALPSVIFSGSIVLGWPARAQITPDATLGTEGSQITPDVTVQGELADLIAGGARRGGNLFHSFEEFNVGAGQRVYFANPLGLENILSRVTGGAPSNLLGTLGVDGPANLYFLNPNGILFGETGRLDIPGSFTATTADAIEFGDDGAFSALNPESPSALLTIAPSAYLFDQATGSIVNRSIQRTGEDFGLFIGDGETLTLLSPEIRFEGGQAITEEGRIVLGGLAKPGRIEIRDDKSLDFVGSTNGAEVSLTEDASVLSFGGGSALIQSGSLLLDDAQIIFGVLGDMDSGDIRILVDSTNGTVRLLNNSIVGTPVLGGGDGGDVLINASRIAIESNSVIGSATNASGNSGFIEITVQDSVTLDDGNIFATTTSAGNAGEISIDARELNLSNTSSISALTSDEETAGNAGNIRIRATDSISLVGSPLSADRPAVPSINSDSGFGSRGNSGNIFLATGQLRLIDGGEISARTVRSNSNSGNITIQADDIQISGWQLFGLAPAPLGGISAEPRFLESRITNRTSGSNPDSIGGDLTINTETLVLENGGAIESSIFGLGNAGNIMIDAANFILIDGKNAPRNSSESLFSANISAEVQTNGQGMGGDILIRTPQLLVENGGRISTSAFNVGSAGDIEIDAGSIRLFGLDLGGAPSQVISIVGIDAIANGGDITVQANRLVLEDGATLNNSTSGQGDAGDITVNADEIQLLGDIADTSSGFFTSVSAGAEGDGGDQSIQANRLMIREGGAISTTTLGNGSAGDVVIQAHRVMLDGVGEIGTPSGIFTRSRESAQGFGGDIDLTANVLNVADSAVINAQTFSSFASGDIAISAGNAEFTNGGQVVTSTSSGGSAGSINLDVLDTARFSGSDATFSDRQQQVLNTPGQVPENFSNESPASGLFANTREGSSGSGGRITVSSPSVILSDRAQIASQSQGAGVAGPVLINASEQLRLIDSDIVTVAARSSGGDILVNVVEEAAAGLTVLTGDSDITTESLGDGGNITLAGAAVIALEDSDIIARSQSGRGGNITLTNFFSENIPPDNQPPFDGDGQVDVNADGQIAAGVIVSPDTSFVENSLNELSGEIVDTATLTAGSCIAREDDAAGSFVVTGSAGLPQQPGREAIVNYPTGTVQTPTDTAATLAVQEPQGVYRLADGRLVLSHECG